MILKNGKVFYNGRFSDLDIQIQKNRIAAIQEGISDLEEEVIDCSGKKIIPGLIDMHSHGCMGFDFSTAGAEEIESMRNYYLSKGITSIAATTMTMSIEEYKKAVINIKEAISSASKGSKIVGINMEGPFLGKGKKGAHDTQYLIPINEAIFEELYLLSGKTIKIVDIDPDLEGSMAFIRKYSKEMTLSIAHTECSYDTANRALDEGASHITHLFNAMNGLHHREPGIVGALFDRDVCAEIICDDIHIHPTVIRMMFKLCPEKLILISDSMCACGLKDGEYILGGLPVFVKHHKATLADGTIAGSTTNVYECMLNTIHFHVPEEKAILSATFIPAKALHLEDEIGSIEVGKIADLVITDMAYELQTVILNGKIAK